MSVRVYLPLTTSRLAGLVEARRLDGPLTGHAVTGRLRAEWPDGDDEQWEYAAMHAAAADSWQLRGEGDQPRRVVVAADVPAVAPDPDSAELTGVRIETDVVWRSVAAAHVDTEDRSPELGPDDVADEDLAWFATQEIASL